MKPRSVGWAKAGQPFTRRRFLAGAGYVAGGIVLAGALDACSGCSGNPQLLTDSPNLDPVPATDLGNEVVLKDDAPYASWTDMFEASENAGKLDFLLMPGDYRKWGVLEFKFKPGNPELPKTLRYSNPGVDDTLHPVLRPVPDPLPDPPFHVTNAALVDSLRFEGSNTKNWFVQGLTVIRPIQNNVILGGAGNIRVDFCLIDHPGQYGFRIRGSDCTIQRCVIREAFAMNQQEVVDSVGIQVKQLPDTEVVRVKILDNEIYNCGDDVQITGVPEPGSAVEVLIEGNDLYLEKSRYIKEGDLDTNTTWYENAIDIKVGSPRPESTIVRNNRMWGFRRRPEKGSLGEIFVVNRLCRNAVIERNIMGDAPWGMKDENWPADVENWPAEVEDLNTPRSIVFRNNQFYEIRDRAILDDGAITKPITSDIRFIRNYFARSDFLADIGPVDPPGYRGVGPKKGPKYIRNILVEVDEIQRQKDPPGPPPTATLPFDPTLNDFATAPDGFESYQRKRWTGPEFAKGAIPRC